MLSLSGSARGLGSRLCQPGSEFWRHVETRGCPAYLLGKQRQNETIASGDSKSASQQLSLERTHIHPVEISKGCSKTKHGGSKRKPEQCQSELRRSLGFYH